MQEFYINKNATLPLLKMELINDGRNSFNKFYEAIQSSTITFSMYNSETKIFKIANENALILPKENSCDDVYYIAYKWKPRDTKDCGKFIGEFKIIFDPNTTNGGTLIVPIQEKLAIYIQQ